MTWQDIGIVLAFLLGAANLAYNIHINRRTTFINTVTSERVKWIEKVRENLARFIGLSHHWMGLRNEESEKKNEIVSELDVLRYQIKLQLNPNGTQDKIIIDKVNTIPDLVCHPDIAPARDAMNDLILAAQNLLKGEWDKVKRESRRGALADSPTLSDRIAKHFPATHGWWRKIVDRYWN
jgi:hypothetical protein